MMANEVEKEEMMMQQLEEYKKIIARAATKEVGLLKMVGSAQALHQCLPRFSYCNSNKDCCSGMCREDDEQEYYTGRATCF